MKNFYDALKIIENLKVEAMGFEILPLDNALNRVLAEDIVSKEDNPISDTSSMDGYAIQHGYDRYKIIDVNPAGIEKDFAINNKEECIKTFTGSIMPKGSDTLIQIENVEVDNGYINVTEQVEKGNAIRYKGDNYNKGEVLLRKGVSITPMEVALLASLNIPEVKVYRKPVVNILCSGSELVDVGEKTDKKNYIRNSNGKMLKSFANSIGAEAILLSSIEDNKGNIRDAVENNLNCDILIMTGGMSVGDYDFSKDIIEEFTETQLFKKVNIKPGKHIKASIAKNGCYIFGLPGFPNSSAVAFTLFIKTLILKMFNKDNFSPISLKAKTTSRLQASGDRLEFRACNISIENGCLTIDINNKKSFQSAIINNMVASSALVVIDKNYEVGEMVDVVLLDNISNIEHKA